MEQQTTEELVKLSLEGRLNLDDCEENEIDGKIPGIKFIDYRDESQIDSVMNLVGKDLSEPYSIFTYRYFLHRFPNLCILAVPVDDDQEGPNLIGCIVCKIDPEDDEVDNDSMDKKLSQNEKVPSLCGYIGMLAVHVSYRRSGIGIALVEKAVSRMKNLGCDSVMLETEVSNKAAMKLYEEKLGFIREEFLSRYYLNNGDAYRLRLWLK